MATLLKTLDSKDRPAREADGLVGSAKDPGTPAVKDDVWEGSNCNCMLNSPEPFDSQLMIRNQNDNNNNLESSFGLAYPTAISHHTASHFHPLSIIPLPPDNTLSPKPHVLVSELHFPLLSNAWCQ